MRLEGLMEPLIESQKFHEIKENIDNKKFPLGIYGLSESGRTYLMNTIFEKSDESLVIVTNSDIEAKNLYEDLIFYTSDVYYFPVREVVFYNIDAISGDLRWARLKVIKEILNSKKKIIVTSIESFAANYTPREYYENHKIELSIHEEVDFNKINRLLVEGGYERVEMVEGKGEFALRGGILDVYPPDSIYPYRIELFGDEIDSIRRFNVESQRSIDKVESVSIFPAKEIIIDEDVIEFAKITLNNELEKALEKNKDKESKEKLKEVINKNLESLIQTSSFETMDSYIPFFYKKLESLFDYFNGYNFIIDDTTRSLGKLEGTYSEFRENF